MFYYFLGFPWNKIIWAVGNKTSPWKTRKRWRTSHQITHISFFKFSKKLVMFNHFPTFYQTDPWYLEVIWWLRSILQSNPNLLLSLERKSNMIIFLLTKPLNLQRNCKGKKLNWYLRQSVPLISHSNSRNIS